MSVASHSESRRCVGCTLGRFPELDVCNPKQGTCRFHRVRLSDREEVEYPQSGAGNVILVMRGVLIREVQDSPHKSVMVDAIGAGGAFLDSSRSPDGHERVYAAGACVVCIMPLSEPKNEGAVTNGIMREVSSIQRQTLRRVETILIARSQPRAADAIKLIIQLLVGLAAPARVGMTVPMGILQKDIAALAGLRQETVSRELRKGEERGEFLRKDGSVSLMHERRPVLGQK